MRFFDRAEAGTSGPWGVWYEGIDQTPDGTVLELLDRDRSVGSTRGG